MRRIVGHIALEKDDLVALADESAAKASPKRGMAIAPRRANCEAEDNEAHKLRMLKMQNGWPVLYGDFDTVDVGV